MLTIRTPPRLSSLLMLNAAHSHSLTRSHTLPFSRQRSKACRWAAVMREFFVRRGDIQELGFREWSADEFHTDRQLGRRRTDEPASVGGRWIWRPIINHSGKPGRDDNRREAAFRAQVDAPTPTRAPEYIQIGFQNRFIWEECRV